MIKSMFPGSLTAGLIFLIPLGSKHKSLHSLVLCLLSPRLLSSVFLAV
jgi:hypothetical protein